MCRELFSVLDYDVWEMFELLGCDTIFEDKAVCSARSYRGQGLGSELCRRTEILARNLGCTHTYACVTGDYLILLSL